MKGVGPHGVLTGSHAAGVYVCIQDHCANGAVLGVKNAYLPILGSKACVWQTLK